MFGIQVVAKEYILEKRAFTLRERIHKSTALTAESFGIENRRQVQVGYFADLIVFKPEVVKDNATFTTPDEYSEEMEWIILNGNVVIGNGKF